eukprot:TRINITY_DN7533_c0_g1_i1.p1 TRINITY_DN7533_c0_g1~~TRINITY_DN7533_c0_g1_i1.p1  ORF type:complete len:531 (+),score=78.96 TRINITY_DN7533_c0_g1_i1:497-2089(+)
MWLFTDPNTPRLRSSSNRLKQVFFHPLLNECNEGVLSTVDDDSNVVAFFCNTQGNIVTSLLSYSEGWNELEDSPLAAWTITSIQSVSSSSSFFLVNTFEGNSLLFTLSNGNISQFMCYTGVSCNGGVVQYSETAWICVGETSTDRKVESPTTTQNRTCASTPIEGWTMFHGNGQHTGQSKMAWSCYPSYATEKALKWSFYLGGVVIFSPIVDLSGRVYVYGNNSVYALFGTNNTVIWSTVIPDGGNTYSAAVDGDVLYISTHNMLYALSCLNGSTIWSVVLSSPSIYSSPIIGPGGGLVYVGTLKSGVFIYDSKGNVIFEYDSIGVLMTTPAIDVLGQTLFFGVSSNPYFFNAKTTNFSTSIAVFSLTSFSSPAIGSDGSVYQGCMNSFLYRLLPDSMTVSRTLLDGMILSSPAISQYGIVYVVTSYGTLFAIACDTMEPLWNVSLTEIKGEYMSSPAVGIDDTVFVGVASSVFAIDGQSGIVKWKFNVNGTVLSSPAIGIDGTVFIAGGSYLYAFHGDLAEDQWVTTPL